MLVLSRKVDERIFIGDSVVLTVVGITSTSVRIGIQAPKDLGIVREELLSPASAGPIGKPSFRGSGRQAGRVARRDGGA
jgi:carbon storage regulator